MTNNPIEPDWSALPQDPETFFGLDPGYDRKDLKRRYNEYLKRYKPEHFPQEFQRIRAAYENLESRLRYDMPPPTFPFPQQTWPSSISSAEQDTSPPTEYVEQEPGHQESRQKTDPRIDPRFVVRWGGADRPLFERIETEPLRNLFDELKHWPHKTPQDYLSLALLADALPDREPLSLLRWLLVGLQAFPDDSSLTEMLHHLLRESWKIEELPEILVAVAEAIHKDPFYFLTEPLWDRLLKESAFSDFAAVLLSCEARITDYRVSGRLTFYLHILRPALWKANRVWLEDAFRALQQNINEIPTHLDFSWEVLRRLRAYQLQHVEFNNGDPVRTEINRVLVGYCKLPDFEFETLFLQFQTSLASGALDIFAAFPPVADRAIQAAYHAWIWVEADVEQRRSITAPTFTPAEEARLARSVEVLLRHLEGRSGPMKAEFLLHVKMWWLFATRLFLIAFVICLVPTLIFLIMLPILIPRSDGPLFNVMMVLLGLTGAVLLWRFRNFYQDYVAPRELRTSTEIDERNYARIWRPELLQFLRDRGITHDLLRTLIGNVSAPLQNTANAILTRGATDIALFMTGSATRFLS